MERPATGRYKADPGFGVSGQRSTEKPEFAVLPGRGIARQQSCLEQMSEEGNGSGEVEAGCY